MWAILHIIFLHSPLATQCICYIVQLVSVFLRRRSFSAALEARCAPLPSLPHRKWICNRTMPPSEDQRCDNRLAPNPGCKEDVEEVQSPVVALSLLSLLLYEHVHCHNAVRLFGQHSSSFLANCRFKFISQHNTVISTVYCLPMRLEMHQNRSVHVPKER